MTVDQPEDGDWTLIDKAPKDGPAGARGEHRCNAGHNPRHKLCRSCWLHREISPTRPFGGVSRFGLLSNSSTLLVRDNPGQPGAALRQLRATGRGATAPAVNRRRGRGKASDSESPDSDMPVGRALTKWVIYFDARFAIFPFTGIFKSRDKKGAEDSILTPQSLSKHGVFLLPDSVTVTSSAAAGHRDRCLRLISSGLAHPAG
jgi:hypothetical protein